MAQHEQSDWIRRLTEAMTTGRFCGFTADSTPQDVLQARGPAQRHEVKKGHRTISYPDADFVFGLQGLRQITLRVRDDADQQAVQSLRERYPVEVADQVPPYFRCLRLLVGPCALEEVLLTLSFPPDERALALAVVFPPRATHRVEVEIPKELYARLQALSNASRRTIESLCVEMIAGAVEKDDTAPKIP